MDTAIWAYPWDFLDEGMETALGRIADAGLRGISVAAAYHSVRALCPHNPRHAVVHGEGGVIYFHPNPRHFEGARLHPVESALLADGDPLTRIGRAAARHGLRQHAWTVLHHNTRLGTVFPECALENAFGDRYPFGLCPANPDVRAYTLGLVRSLAEREEVAVIELESAGYMGLDHTGHHSKAGIELPPLHRFLLSLCFCPHCVRAMTTQKVDTARARADVLRELQSVFAGEAGKAGEGTLEALAEVLGPEQAAGILAAREEVVVSLLAEARAYVRPPQTLCVMAALSPLTTGAQVGGAPERLAGQADRLLHQAFHREPGAIRETVERVRAEAGATPVYAGLQAIAPIARSAGELAAQVTAAREAGADGVQFYHYGLMPLENLAWICDAIAAQGGRSAEG